MYIVVIKLFAINEKELETLIQTITIYSQDIGMKFDIEKYTMLIIKSGKMQGIELLNQERIRVLGEKELKNTKEYWKWTLLNKCRWKKKSFSDKRETFSKLSIAAEI